MPSISGQTKLIGLLGQPVNHSISPVIHNAALEEMGLDWCYVAMSCNTANISIVLKGLRNLDFQGLNITIPHKKLVAKECVSLSNIAEKIGAVNTLLPANEESWEGTNTDIEGFLAPLKRKSFSNNFALIIGCGGSAKAVAAGLIELGFKEITIIGRDDKKLKSFIKELTIAYHQAKEKTTILNPLISSDLKIIQAIKQAQLIINTTPIGMQSFEKEPQNNSLIPLGEKIWSNLNSKTIVYDLIYTPRPTQWLQLAKEINCEVIDGLEMLLHQGAASLRLWSGEKDIPIKKMRDAAEIHLKD